MARYIDADRLINEVSGNGGVFVYGPKTVAAIVSRINSQPTADVAEVKHAYWKEVEDKGKICSECGKSALFADFGTVFARSFHLTRSKYCPNCGAKMDGKGGTE